ncbi:MAG: hypothetical protein IPL23_13480 [Saprospiraceae bacterium]|nr:hypothetical protein [Saprospiraceae bacterium]
MNDANITPYHEDGRVRKVGSSWKYDYYIKDHLGNIRVVFEDIDGNEIITPEEIKGRYDYYSFGMQHAGNGLGYLGSDQKEVYSYNGKELVEEMNANLLLYGARQMDGALGRWFGIDALAEEYPSTSPYVYAMNNPIFLIDPDGMRVDSYYLVNTETNVVTPIDDRGGNAVDYIYFWNGKPLAEEGGRMDLLVKNVEPVYTNEVYSPAQTRLPGYIIHNSKIPKNDAVTGVDNPITVGISKATFGSLGLLYALVRTSSKSKLPSVVYTIYNADKSVFKFGVSGANLKRYESSLKMAGDGAFGKISNVITKQEAHLYEKYLKSLHFTSTGFNPTAMKYPYSINLITGKLFKP